MQKRVVDYLVASGEWHRAVSLDIEADLRTLDEPTKPILSISVSNRVDGEVGTSNFIAESETQESELQLLGRLGEFCESRRPLVIIGYNLMRFDNLILSLKIRQLDTLFRQTKQYSSAYWALRETLGRSYFLDLLDPVRFEIGSVDGTSPKMVSLETASLHRRFSHLPLKRAKSNVSSLMSAEDLDKWQAVRRLWQTDRGAFEKYVSGDSHDALLIAEDLFGVRQHQ